jgi:hypothetical protein
MRIKPVPNVPDAQFPVEGEAPLAPPLLDTTDLLILNSFKSHYLNRNRVVA